MRPGATTASSIQLGGRSRRCRAFAAIPIIAVSSFAVEGNQETARSAGREDYVTKSYSPSQLARLIRGLLGDKPWTVCGLHHLSHPDGQHNTGGDATSQVPIRKCKSPVKRLADIRACLCLWRCSTRGDAMTTADIDSRLTLPNRDVPGYLRATLDR